MVVALWTAIAGLMGSYAIAGPSPVFLAAAVERSLTRAMPGSIIAVVIATLGGLGQVLNFFVAVCLVVGGLATIAGVAMWLGGRLERDGASVLAVAGFGTIGTAPVTGSLPNGLAVGTAMALALGAGLTAGTLIERASRALDGDDEQPMPAADRRRVVGTAVVAVATSAVSYVLGASGVGRESPDAGDPVERVDAASDGEGESVASLRQTAAERSFDVSGLEPLVSTDFYEVDINAVNPDVSREAWSLSVTGAVENEFTLDYEQLRALPAENRLATLRCVGDPINGQEMDTAIWTGVPASILLDRARPKSGCECVMLRAADDYYEEFPLAALEPGVIAYGMNGRTLPRRHGYPARALVPGHWGEVNVKWLTEIEVLDREATGYWEKRGWQGTGPVNTVAKLHAVEHREDGRIAIGGHTYAGTRGIQSVEVSLDGGSSWRAATLSESLPGDDVWRQWRYEYASPGVEHDVVVRAIDGTGAIQSNREQDAYPSGASGWVSRSITPD